jgi:hypothetical protein
MNYEKLDFSHKDQLVASFSKIKVSLSEYSFANVYLFRKNHQYEVIGGEQIYLRGRTYDEKIYLMPTVDIGQLDLDHLKNLLSTVDFLFPVPEEWLPYFPESEFSHSFNEADTDYIYTVEKMATFKGRRLSKKRNLLKQFLELYQPDTFCLGASRIKDALQILDQWQEDIELPPGETDYQACLESLQMLEELDLFGIIYYVNQEPAGFIISEDLTDSMLALHFAKGEKKFKGLYQYMYNTFANVLSEKYTQLNFEQDLGKLALKIAKSSYIPDVLLKKYRVALHSTNL